MPNIPFNKRIMFAPGTYTGEYYTNRNGATTRIGSTGGSASGYDSEIKVPIISVIDGYEFMIEELTDDYFISEDGILIEQE